MYKSYISYKKVLMRFSKKKKELRTLDNIVVHV